MKTPTAFTYLIGWKDLNLWYHGVRYADTAHPDDLWTTYFTSSFVVEDVRRVHGEPDVIQVRQQFTGPDRKIKATKAEARVHRMLDVANSPKWLNKNNAGGMPSTPWVPPTACRVSDNEWQVYKPEPLPSTHVYRRKYNGGTAPDKSVFRSKYHSRTMLS